MTQERDLTPADFPVLRRIGTRWGDEDVYGHINNVVYYSYFDTAVNGYLIEATELDVRELDAYGVVVETGCRYFHELRFPGDITVGIALEKLGTSSVAYRLALFQGTSQAPAAVGQFVHVYVDHQTRRPTRVPGVIREALTTLRESRPHPS